MQFIKYAFAFILALSQIAVPLPTAHAQTASPILISHIIAGETGFSNAEFVALYNNGATDSDITGYCLKSGGSTTVPFVCIQAEQNTRVFIKAHNYLTVATTSFAANHAYAADSTYPAANKIAVGGDTVSLLDAGGAEIDSVTWGPGGISLATNGTLIRKEASVGSGQLLDTNQSSDFTSLATLVYPPNASYDVVTIIDVCPNMTGVQQAMPVGYLADQNGNCQPDSCLNIQGLQITVPVGFDSDNDGNCVEHDECSNVPGVQTQIPANMIRGELNNCIWDVVPLKITELMPNAVGSDTGNEFIEIYNPTDRTIDLSLYTLKIGVNGEKKYSFPADTSVAPSEYRSFSDAVMKFTLPNTSGRVVLASIDDQVLDDSGVYTSPKENESWALLTDKWEYTNQPTPGAENLQPLTLEQESDGTDASPAPCPAGKYRHPLTNRCRNIETDASVLAACDSDQYRSPETGRCRKISVASITPCKDGQYRSEETNRCRNIVTASTLKPCNDNQYRSEETGRCRNLQATSVPKSAFAVEPVKDSAMAFVGWWAFGGVGLLAIGYAGWEWRREIMSGLLKFSSIFSVKK